MATYELVLPSYRELRATLIPAHVADLPRDNLARPFSLRLPRRLLQDLERVDDRCEGIPQLVRQHRQELVFAPGGFLKAFGELTKLLGLLGKQRFSGLALRDVHH